MKKKEREREKRKGKGCGFMLEDLYRFTINKLSLNPKSKKGE